MAMPSENGVVMEKSRFPVGGEMLHQRQWWPDERDGLIMWLRGEFAAANAMIDSLCDHLRAIGEPGEYDGVVASIQDRRCNWSPVLHMQQFFSISEVLSALQQAGWRRQQRKGPGKEFRKSGSGFRQGQRGEFVKGERVVEKGEKGERVVENGFVTSDDRGGAVVEDKRDMVENLKESSCIKVPDSPQEMISHNSEPNVKPRVDCEGHCDAPLENVDLRSIQNRSVKQNGMIIPTTFVANEILYGKTVNVVDGMKLYTMLDISEVTKMVQLVNDVRAAGKRGELQGHTFVWSKRPMKGHGREMIQLGLPITDALPEDQNVLPIPQLLQDVIDRLVLSQVLTVKPDSCTIDVFSEGDYSPPQMWPSRYGRPVSVLFLTDCEMTFGKLIGTEYPGDYKGSLRLSLQPGSLLVLQGNSVDLAKYAMSSFNKQRIFITLTKLQPRKPARSDIHLLLSPAVAPVPQWGPLPSRSPNHVRYPMPKHCGPNVTNVVLPAPHIRSSLGSPNGMHPIFISPPVTPVMPFPAPVTLPPRLPLPGTGVFLPPGSSNSLLQPITVTDTSFSAEPDKENDLANPNESKLSRNTSHKEFNGSSNGATGGGGFGVKEGEQQDVEPQAGNRTIRDI